MKKIGIDFDNTLVIYDQLFYKVAIERNLIPLEKVRSKLEIRNLETRSFTNCLNNFLQLCVFNIQVDWLYAKLNM